jgi:hypothetical protein
MLMFLQSSLGYWVEISDGGLRVNAIIGFTPGGPIGSRHSIKYEQMRSLLTRSELDEEFGRVVFVLSYSDKTGQEQNAEFGIDVPLASEFLNLLLGQARLRGVQLDMMGALPRQSTLP